MASILGASAAAAAAPDPSARSAAAAETPAEDSGTTAPGLRSPHQPLLPQPGLRDSGEAEEAELEAAERRGAEAAAAAAARSWRAAAWRLTSASGGGARASRWFELSVVALVLANVILGLVATSTRDDREWDYGERPFLDFFHVFEFVSAIIFTAEYLLRLWCCVEEPAAGAPARTHARKRLDWALGGLALIDLVVVAVFWVDIGRKWGHLMEPSDSSSPKGSVTGLRLFRLLRLFSLLRVERQSHSFQRLGAICKAKTADLVVCFFTLAVLLTFAATFMFAIEGHESDEALFTEAPGESNCDEQRNHFRYLSQCFYWAATTISTVGYGDLHPCTVAGQIVASVASILGVFFFALPTAILASGFVEDIENHENESGRESVEMVAFSTAYDAPGVASTDLQEQVAALALRMGSVENKLDRLLDLLK